MQLKDLVAFWAVLLLKRTLLKQIGNDLEEYPRAPTSIANRSTAQPFSSMTLASGYIYLIFGSASSPYSLHRGKSVPTGMLDLRILKLRQYHLKLSQEYFWEHF